MSQSDVIQRSLPEEQTKISEEDKEKDKEEVSIQTMERAMELSSQYEDIKDRTVDDNTVLGLLKEIDTSENNSTIIVQIDLPGEGSNKQFRFDKPKVWSDSYRFVRWINHYDYDADSFPNMLDDRCKVKVRKEDDGYELFVPNEDKFTPDLRMEVDWRRMLATYANMEIPITPFVVFSLGTVSTMSFVGLLPGGFTSSQYGAVLIILLALALLGTGAEIGLINYLDKNWHYR